MHADRLFLSVPIPREVKQEIAVIAGHVHDQLRFSTIAWTPIENYHITLHFLGDIPRDVQGDFVSDLVAKEFPRQFELRLKEVSAFPNKKNPQTLFVETTVHPSLLGLRKRVGDVVSSFGMPIDEREWHSHITIGRVKKRSEILKPEEIPVKPMKFLVKGFVLMKSMLQSEGSKYELVHRFRLEKKNSKDE
ncbi:MAG: RNA 2',3'-cyclic phosphodiesterase [Patescibacteria group bacterium]|jgi:2'-5' RNA ligase